MTRWLLLAILWPAVLAGPAGPASAHSNGTTGYAAMTVGGQTVRYVLSLPAEATPAVDPLTEAVARHVHIRADGRACEPVPEGAAPPDPERATVQIVVLYACGSPVSNLQIRDDMTDLLGTGHHTLATVEWAGGRTQLAFDTDSREGRVVLTGAEGAAGADADRPAATVFGSYLMLGIEHILLGFDHVLFVLALVLQGGRLLPIIAVVTAFTVAHSVTLALSVLGALSVPAAIVEPLIALSIAYVAAENVFLTKRAASRRWWVSLIFGLVHGFGFAGALQEVGLPAADLAAALLSFNLGVEAGQALIVALVVPVLIWARQFAWESRVIRLASAAIMSGGLALLLERTLLGSA